MCGWATTTPTRSRWYAGIAGTPGPRCPAATAWSAACTACRWVGLRSAASTRPPRACPGTVPSISRWTSTETTASDAPTGSVPANCPNLATIVAQRDDEAAAARQTAERLARERRARHAQRRHRRRQLVAGEGYVARDLADWLDRLDADSPRGRALGPAEREAARQVIEAARHAPQLFSPPLVETLLDLAIDTAEPTAFTAITHLVHGGRCEARPAVEAVLRVLPHHRVPEAALVLDAFGDQLHAADLPPVLDALVEMAAERHELFDPRPAVPDGLLAAARTDLHTVTARLVDRLGSDDEWTRADVADAAAILLREDPGRVAGLGPALVAGIRGEDVYYAGYPHPAGAATRALAEAWRGEPDTTVAIIEAGAAALSAEARRELIRTVAFVRHGREPMDATGATRAAVEFCVRRLGGDWGEEATRDAGAALEQLAREVPAQLLLHVDSLLGALLTLCATPAPSPLTVHAPPGEPAQFASLQAMNQRVVRDGRTATLARTIGRLAQHNPAEVLHRVLPLFEASSGDPDQDRQVRVALMKLLTDGVSAESLRDLLPQVYTGLLGGDQRVRAAAIRLWAACAAVAEEAILDQLTDLAEVLLTDQYLVVVRTMLDKLPALRLPTRLAPPPASHRRDPGARLRRRPGDPRPRADIVAAPRLPAGRQPAGDGLAVGRARAGRPAQPQRPGADADLALAPATPQPPRVDPRRARRDRQPGTDRPVPSTRRRPPRRAGRPARRPGRRAVRHGHGSGRRPPADRRVAGIRTG